MVGITLSSRDFEIFDLGGGLFPVSVGREHGQGWHGTPPASAQLVIRD